MNNSQFRNLLAGKKNGTSEPSQHGSKTSMLGSRAQSSVPMTPRSLGGHNRSREFARQVCDQQNESRGEPPAKKFKASSAPKGTKLASGYIDRSSDRREDDDDNTQEDKVKRLKALEEMLKLQQIDQQTFDNLREQLGVGGDTSSTHLVKGLDWRLLERVRRGEDINKVSEVSLKSAEELDVDEELERALEKEVAPQTQERTIVNQSRVEAEDLPQPTTRDEILRQLKQSRLASGASNSTVAPTAPVLGDKFRKFGEPSSKSGKKKYTETVNGRRREVLVITDKEGNTKRKTRWLDPEITTSKAEQQSSWGGDVSSEIAARQATFKAEQERKLAEEEEEEANGDIFADAGEYDPLAGVDSASSEDDDEFHEKRTKIEPKTKNDGNDDTKAAFANVSARKSEQPTQPRTQRRNYFSTNNDAIPEDASEHEASRITQDPTVLAALKRAAQLRQGDQLDPASQANTGDDNNPEQESRQRALLARLKERDRQDALDMDMGFGESRFGDEEDDHDGEPLANWGDNQGAEGAGTEKKSGGSRKRGPKKRKGNKDNVQDIMNVLEGRKQK